MGALFISHWFEVNPENHLGPGRGWSPNGRQGVGRKQSGRRRYSYRCATTYTHNFFFLLMINFTIPSILILDYTTPFKTSSSKTTDWIPSKSQTTGQAYGRTTWTQSVYYILLLSYLAQACSSCCSGLTVTSQWKKKKKKKNDQFIRLEPSYFQAFKFWRFGSS
jgi:hypothetical protein